MRGTAFGPSATELGTGEKSASEGLDAFLAFLNFSRRAPQGSTTVRGAAVGGGFTESSLGCMSHLSGSAPAHALNEPAVRDVNYEISPEKKIFTTPLEALFFLNEIVGVEA